MKFINTLTTTSIEKGAILTIYWGGGTTRSKERVEQKTAQQITHFTPEQLKGWVYTPTHKFSVGKKPEVAAKQWQKLDPLANILDHVKDIIHDKMLDGNLISWKLEPAG